MLPAGPACPKPEALRFQETASTSGRQAASQLLCNRSLCWLRAQGPHTLAEQAARDADLAVHLDGSSVKVRSSVWGYEASSAGVLAACHTLVSTTAAPCTCACLRRLCTAGPVRTAPWV